MSEQMPLSDLLANYRDGDEHGWATEFDFLLREHGDRLRTLLLDVEQNGILEPILLGNDGRVWDGHHRLFVALHLKMTHVPVRHGGGEPS